MRYSTYFWTLWAISIALMYITLFVVESGTAAAVTGTLSFITGYAAIMAPMADKYKQ